VARPESVRKRRVRLSSRRISPCLPRARAIPQAKTTTTLVRIAVARFESTCATPILASRAVAAAKMAERMAHPIQVMTPWYAEGAQAAQATLDFVETGRASKTAFRVAMRRAAHQVLDQPPVLADPVAVPLLGAHFALDREREAHSVVRAFRAFMAARSRYAEDRLWDAVAAGVEQYVVLGAGLDTFAYRNPFPDLRVFEVDFPATQEWKRALLDEASIHVPENLTFVPLDFEHRTLGEGLDDAGFDASAPAFFGWLGVVPYLSREAFRATVQTIARQPRRSGVSFDYALSPESMSPSRRAVFEALAARVAAAGEPFQLFFTPEQLEAELREAGFQEIEHMDSEQLNAKYFRGRSDGLQLPPEGLGMMATAWV
jgi:methyltransferase (TIGR00027 family)